MLFVLPLANVVPKHSVVEFLLTQMPVVFAVAVCYVIRKKLIASVSAS